MVLALGKVLKVEHLLSQQNFAKGEKAHECIYINVCTMKRRRIYGVRFWVPRSGNAWSAEIRIKEV